MADNENQNVEEVEVEELLDEVAGGRPVGGLTDPPITTDVI
ncbi:hypothetical protein OG762_34165 [Streptomyces sp. NBC_01136]|nr:hypothetical protein OG762_34165 [Streptomyces sp. NBC_01136]